MFFEAAAINHHGLKKPANEDFCHVAGKAVRDGFAGPIRAETPTDRIAGLALVADGMGNRPAGFTAASMAGQGILHGLQSIAPGRFAQRIQDVCTKTQARMEAHGKTHPEDRGMGSTLTALCHDPAHGLHLLHAGDSRACLQDGGKLTQLTTDHIDRKRGLFQVFGKNEDVPQMQIQRLDSRPGMLWLVCSDGLTDMVAHRRIQAVLADPGTSLLQKVKILESLALAGGGKDNITAILIHHQRSNP